VLIAGNPNAGKTTVFNALSGARARVGNYPGITVERLSTRVKLADGIEIELVDLPGTYSLSARSPEEQVAADAILGRDSAPPEAVIVVVDATALGRSLYLALQTVQTGVPTVIALNMMDEIEAAGRAIDHERLSKALGAAVVPVVGSRRRGFSELKEAVRNAVQERQAPEQPPLRFEATLERDIATVEEAVEAAMSPKSARLRRSWALWCLLSLGDDELRGVPDTVRAATEAVRRAALAAGRDVDVEIIGGRYALIDGIVDEVLSRHSAGGPNWTERIDSVLTHPVLGFLVFVVVLYGVFEALFSWSEPLIGFIENRVGELQGVVTAGLGAGPLRGLLVDGVIGGVGNVLVFVPPIALLFLCISFLEDSGYLARVAFLIDRLMQSVGLHGRAFVPLLSGFACAVPAVMATRTIEHRRDRLVTMLALPLASCSARLPVYVTIIAAVFAPGHQVFGIISTGAVVLIGMYLLSMAATLSAAAILRRTVLRGPRPPLVMELPPYRMPLLRNLLWTVWQRVRTFLVDAGTIILALTIVLWAMLSYPRSDEVAADFAARRAEVVAVVDADHQHERIAALDAQEASAQLRHSIGGQIGTALEPVIAPLGFDWRIGIGILGAFAAREVFVSTLGIVFGIGETDEQSEPLREALRDARRNDGSPLMTPLTGLSLMVFFVFACQCMGTIAVVRRESGSWKWPLFMLLYMSVLAYVASLIVYQGGRALGLA